MAQPAKFEQAPQPRRQSRVKAEHRYPVYDLNASLEVARAIRDQGGGSATSQQLASFLGYSTTNSGAFITRVAGARLFGLIEKTGAHYVPTTLAATILSPEHPGQDDLGGRIEAFNNVPLYRLLYQRYQTGPLPPEMGLRNAMETQFGMSQRRTQMAYRVFMDSADQAGFFQTRGGAQTHLVEPTIPPGHRVGSPAQEPEGVPPDEAIRDEPPPRIEMGPEKGVIEKLREALVEKIKDVPATELDTIREYIKEIKELGDGKEDQRE